MTIKRWIGRDGTRMIKTPEETLYRKGLSLRRGLGVLVVSLMFLGGRCNRATEVKLPQTSVCQEGEVINVSCDSLYSASPAVTSRGGDLYFVWGSTTGPYDYASLRCVFRAYEGGEWTGVDTVSGGPTWGCQLAVDRRGRVHVVWEEDDLERNESAAMYRMRDEHGVWGPPQRLSPWSNPEKQVRIGVDPSGRVHVIWGGHYKSRSPEGMWDVEEESVPVGLNPFMVVDSVGGVHVVWQSADDVLAYSYREPGGKWLQEEVARSPRAWAVIADQDVEVVGGVVWVSAVIATDTGRGWSWGLWRRVGPGQWERVRTLLASRYLASVRVVPAGDVWFVTYMMWEERIGGWRDRLLWGFWREGGWVEAGTLAVYEDREPILFSPVCTMGAWWGVWTVDEGEGFGRQYEVWIRKIRR